MGAKKKRKKSKNDLVKVRFSIGAKLITIISIIVLLSLGSITALVSWLFYGDMQIAAEANNIEVNSRSAMEVNYTLTAIRSNSLLLMQTAVVLGAERFMAERTGEFFFEQNPQTAALIFSAEGTEGEPLINRHFFLTKGVDASLAAPFFENNRTSLRRAAAGETVILNAAPWFNVPLIAMFFPGGAGGGAVLFSPENLNDSFGFGINKSYLINDHGDILIHPDFELVQAGTNIADQDFVQDINKSSEQHKQQTIEVDPEFLRAGTNTAKGNFFISIGESLQQAYTTAFNAVSGFLRIETQAKDTGEDKKIRLFMAYTKLNIAGSTLITSIEYDNVFEQLFRTTRRNIYLSVAVLFISIMLIWFFAKSISVPLKGLAAAAHSIEGGTFELELKPKSRDEIGVLTDSFQHMCTALGIFGRFTNRDIAVKAMRGEIKPGGLPRHATVFFSDIRGFTEKSENFTKIFGDEASDRIVQWLNEYLTRMVECVEKTSGVVDKFIGDAVMAHWGTAYTAGTPQKDAINCVTAALMMRTTLYQMNKSRRENNPGNPLINIGCGINTGIVTAGQIGSDMRMEYTVIGDPVNLASRIESLNKPLGTDILISEDTWRMVKNQFIVEEMPSVSVKGKEKPVRIFAVVNFTKSDKGPKTLAEVRRILGVNAPDISKVDVNADEKKYAIGQ